MGDHEGKDAAAIPLGARMRGAFGKARQHGAVSLRGVGRSVAEATERLKGTETAERLSAAVETRRTIKKAVDAQKRGNQAMAYRLLEPEVSANPDDARVVGAFWNAAVACGRAEDAVPAMRQVIRKLAVAGKLVRAAELWRELRGSAPDSLLDPGSLVRMVPALEAEDRSDEVVTALRDAVDANNSGLSPGLALRVAELAHDLDPATAVCAARHALASSDLDGAKRARMEALVAELAKAEAAEPSVAPKEFPSDESMDRTPKSDLVRPSLAARFADIKVTEGMPTQLLEDAIGLQLLAGRKVRIEYSKIDAIAVGEVWGLALHPVVMIDLVLNWREDAGPALRVIRFRSDGFDPRMLIEAPADPDEALGCFLEELLRRCNPVPLPDLDSARGVCVLGFDDLETYEREVLQVER